MRLPPQLQLYQRLNLSRACCYAACVALTLSAASPALATTPASERGTNTPDQSTRQHIDVHVFMHDDTAAYTSRERFHADYVAWWEEDMRQLFPTLDVTVRYHPPIQGMTDMPYRYPGALAWWHTQANQWAENEDVDRSHLTKFLLVTTLGPWQGVAGVAYKGGNVAMASLVGRYGVIAHELGHLLGAEHEDSEVLYRGGWWCETNMFPRPLSLRSNCYVYTEANQQRIRTYLSNGSDPAPVAASLPTTIVD